MARDIIFVKGARENNLQDIDVSIPRDKLVVVTGISGSGKSSLAFDTIFAEGQRRYVESLSAYARQFLGQMDKPDVDYIEGLSPAISIDQKTTSRNPRSTVGTVTEIYDYLRLLYARIGRPHCPQCGKPITQQTVDQMVDQIMDLPVDTRIQVLGPIVRGRKGEYKNLIEDIKNQGYVRLRIDGEVHQVHDEIDLDKNRRHTIEVVVDRLVIKEGLEKRLADSLETALELSGDIVIIDVLGGSGEGEEDRSELIFSQSFACVDCSVSIEELTPRMFSFNSPYGACPECDGLGTDMKVDPNLVIPDKRKSIDDGAVEPWNTGSEYYSQMLTAVAKTFGFSTEDPIEDLSDDQLDILLYGNRDQKVSFSYVGYRGRQRKREVYYRGVINYLERYYRDTSSDSVRANIEEYMSSNPCPACNGARLRPESLAVKIGGRSISEITAMSVVEALDFFEALSVTERELLIGRQVLKEIKERLGFLADVGLDYLTLSRSAGTLAGGEAQRIRLATQIGSSLVGVLYILDEPSIGLHQRDNERLIRTLERLRDLGNTLVIVEHDEETMRRADHIIDIGPGAGKHGGLVVAEGTMDEVAAVEDSITGQYLSGRRQIPVPTRRREGNGQQIVIRGARQHNLKDTDVEIPLGRFVCVTGVSGSGKSTLVNEILYKAVAQKLTTAKARPGEHDGIDGVEHLEKVIEIDQSPIGRTPRSNPATYTGVFTYIRELFAQTPEAKVRGYKTGRFSFNVRGGRCEACKGHGINKIEMHFLPDVYVPCEICDGRRYNRETLQVRYKGKNIADVLEMTVDEALGFFENIPRIKRKLQTIHDVGLGYIHLGQPATQLSGGEAQRVKLATELSRRSNGKTLYILDEPTTGLHFEDIHRLLLVLDRLVEDGATVLVIEHNLDVIKVADWIIDLGPEGGDRGGEVVTTGTPEEVSTVERSYTGQFLKRVLPR